MMFEWLKKLFNRKYIETNQVFTPTTSASLNYVSRTDLENQIKNSLNTPGKQLVLYGYSGSGKTTIISKILKEKKLNYVITHCGSATTYEDILLAAFDSLDKYYIDETTTKKSYKIDSSLSGQYKSIKTCLTTSREECTDQKLKRYVPPQLTYEKLAEFLGKTNSVWIIEDFHKVLLAEKRKIADAMKTFVDLGSTYKNTRIICIGACDTAREIIQADSNMMHRVDQIYVSMLNETEMTALVVNGFKLLNVEIEESIVNKIVHNSSRVGSLAHQMCLDICVEKKIEHKQKKKIQITDSDFHYAVNGFINRNSDTFSSVYEQVIKEKIGWYILKTFTALDTDKITFDIIKNRVNRKGRNYSDAEIKNQLEILVDPSRNLLYYNANTGNYAISTPFWKTWLKLQFDHVERKNSNKKKKGRIEEINVDDADATIQKLMLELIDRLQKSKK